MKDIPGFEGLYAATEDGQIWSYPKHRNITGRFLKPCPVGMKRRYWGVTLTKGKVNRNYGIHRLVALTYVPNPENKPYVNHIDYDPHNNHFSNLEWVTASENTLWSAKIGAMSRKGKSNGRYKYPSEIVKEVLNQANNGTPLFRIAKEMNLPPTLVRFYVSGKLRKEVDA